MNTPISAHRLDQIQRLRERAAGRGDQQLTDRCDRALAGDAAAAQECGRIIADERAQRDQGL